MLAIQWSAMGPSKWDGGGAICDVVIPFLYG